MPELTYAQAVNAALRRALEERPEVVVYGEDVGKPGGVHGVTRGLHRSFGDRVFDTPISESSILGSAIGMSMVGLRPVVEIMWADFVFVAFDQLINQASNVRYVSRGELTAPITVRMQQGAAPGACAQHSQSIEAFLAHIPGLRVALPSNPQDAYDITLAAIAADDPTVVIENRTLYHSMRSEVSFAEQWPVSRAARVVRSGTDITAVTWGATVNAVLSAAAMLDERAGIDVEVIDLRWLNPLDDEAVALSLSNTGALAVVHEANQTGGFGAEIVARMTERGIPLSPPPLRIATPDMRIPAAPSLLSAVVPSADLIARRLEAAVTSR